MRKGVEDLSDVESGATRCGRCFDFLGRGGRLFLLFRFLPLFTDGGGEAMYLVAIRTIQQLAIINKQLV